MRNHSFLHCQELIMFQVVKMLIAVVTIFATLWLPHRGLLVYNTVASLRGLPRYMDLWYLMFAKTCIYINRSQHEQNISYLILFLQCYQSSALQSHVNKVQASIQTYLVL